MKDTCLLKGTARTCVPFWEVKGQQASLCILTSETRKLEVWWEIGSIGSLSRTKGAQFIQSANKMKVSHARRSIQPKFENMIPTFTKDTRLHIAIYTQVWGILLPGEGDPFCWTTIWCLWTYNLPAQVRLDPPGTYITVSSCSPYLRLGIGICRDGAFSPSSGSPGG